MSDYVELVKPVAVDGGNSIRQSYSFDFLPLVPGVYPPKVRLVLQAPNREGVFSNMSLYCLDPSQLRVLLLDLSYVYACFLREQGLLNDYTCVSIPYKLNKDVINQFKKVREGF